MRFFEILNAEKERLPEQIDFDALRRLVRNLSEDEAYVKINKMEILGSALEPRDQFQLYAGVPVIALDRITRDPRMRIERRRNYRPLILGDDENLAEPTYYSIYDNNVLGMMRNSGSAPSVASFREYMNKILGRGNEIEVAPLVDRNFLRALRNVEILTRVDLELGPDVVADVFDRATTFEGQVRALRQNLGAVGVEIIIKMDPKRHSEESDKVLQEMEYIATSGALAYAESASIVYRDIDNYRRDTYDFLKESVTTSVSVDVDSATDQPTDDSVCDAMYLAYDRKLDDIRSALTSLGEA